MYILSCLADNKQINNQCGGGNPSLVVDLIMNNGGISTNCAQNYYKLCEAQEFCHGDGKDHMIASADITLDDRNKFIPQCGRCTDEKPKLFTIKKKLLFILTIICKNVILLNFIYYEFHRNLKFSLKCLNSI